MVASLEPLARHKNRGSNLILFLHPSMIAGMGLDVHGAEEHFGEGGLSLGGLKERPSK